MRVERETGAVAVVDAADDIRAAVRNRANLGREADGLELGREERGGLDLPSRRVLRVDGDEPLEQAREPSDIGRGREGRRGSLHFPSRRDLVEGFDPSLPGGVDPVEQVRHHAGVVGNDGDELADLGLSRAWRRAHMSVLFAQAIDLPVGMLENAAVAVEPEQIGRQASSIRRR